MDKSIKGKHFGVAFIGSLFLTLLLINYGPQLFSDTHAIHILNANIDYSYPKVYEDLHILSHSMSTRDALEVILEEQELKRLKEQRFSQMDKWPDEELMRYAEEHAHEQW